MALSRHPSLTFLVRGALSPRGPGIVEGNEIPYRPEALEKKRANFENRLTIDPQNMHETGDPEAKCYLPGVPRAMYQPYPFPDCPDSGQDSDRV